MQLGCCLISKPKFANFDKKERAGAFAPALFFFPGDVFIYRKPAALSNPTSAPTTNPKIAASATPKRSVTIRQVAVNSFIIPTNQVYKIVKQQVWYIFIFHLLCSLLYIFLHLHRNIFDPPGFLFANKEVSQEESFLPCWDVLQVCGLAVKL